MKQFNIIVEKHPRWLRGLPFGAQRCCCGVGRYIRGIPFRCEIGNPLSHWKLRRSCAGCWTTYTWSICYWSWNWSLMAKFSVDAPKRKVSKTLEVLGFQLVREREHISMMRENIEWSKMPLTMPNHRNIKASTLRTICTQVSISRDEFLTAYEKV